MSGDHNMYQKPVAWFHEEKYKTHFTTNPSEDMIGRYWQPLYTAPQSNNDFKPDWDTVKAYDEKFAEMLDEQQRLRTELKVTEQRLRDVATLCATVEASLFQAQNAAIGLTAQLEIYESALESIILCREDSLEATKAKQALAQVRGVVL